MNNRIFYLLVVFVCLAALTFCEDPSDSPIIGTWKTADPTDWEDVDISRYLPPGIDYDFSGTWRFKKDGSYHLDFYSASIETGGEGYASGTYDLLSDSIMTIHQTEYESGRSAGDYAYGDTLHIVLKDTMLITTRVDSYNPFALGDQSFYWQRSQ